MHIVTIVKSTACVVPGRDDECGDFFRNDWNHSARDTSAHLFAMMEELNTKREREIVVGRAEGKNAKMQRAKIDVKPKLPHI